MPYAGRHDQCRTTYHRESDMTYQQQLRKYVWSISPDCADEHISLRHEIALMILDDGREQPAADVLASWGVIPDHVVIKLPPMRAAGALVFADHVETPKRRWRDRFVYMLATLVLVGINCAALSDLAGAATMPHRSACERVAATTAATMRRDSRQSHLLATEAVAELGDDVEAIELDAIELESCKRPKLERAANHERKALEARDMREIRSMTFPIYGNATLDDCTYAAAADYLRIRTGVQLPEAAVIASFEASGGQGLTGSQFVAAMAATGVAGQQLTLREVPLSQLGAYVSAQRAVIAVAVGNQPLGAVTFAGGHAIVVDGTSANGVQVVTWGQTLLISWTTWNADALSIYAQ